METVAFANSERTGGWATIGTAVARGRPGISFGEVRSTWARGLRP